MEDQSRFIKNFSKRESPEKRSRLAQEIREKRRRHFADKNIIEEIEQEKSETIKKIEALRDQVESYNDANFLIKIKDFFAIKKIEGELQSQRGKYSSIEDDLSESISGRQDLEETRKMVADFYVKEKKKWAELPYSKEDIAENFTGENLTSLSMEDYATLLQRFPGEMLTHVTRHGIRDHANLNNHQAGLGEYHDTLYKVLEKKNLKSALGIKLQENSKEEAVAEYLELENCSSRNEALGRINERFVSGATGDPNSFADLTAVHFAVEDVADSFYGSERNNEVFFAFPSALIASQYEFAGNLAEVEMDGYTDSYNNDQYVFPDIEKGLSIDAGIAFIPKDAKVDLKTGSRYELDESKRPILAEGVQEILKARFDQLGFVQDFIQRQYKIDNLPENERGEATEKRFDSFGIKDEVAKKILSDENILKKLAKIWGAKNEKNEYEKIIAEYCRENKFSLYKLAADPVPSKEYWENYFQQHPESKPKHLVYYVGGDPAEALDNWRKRNGITKKDRKRDIGFAENEVSKVTKNKDETQQRFVSIAKSLVDKYFPTNGENPSYEYNWREQ